MDRILNILIFLITLYFTVKFFRKDGKWSIPAGHFALRYFTAQSNVLCAVSALLLALNPDSHASFLMKYIGTAAVTVTMLTVFLFLGPLVGGVGKLLKGSDLFMHLVTPVLALLSFLFFERHGLTFPQCLLGMLPVLLYGPLYLYKIKFAPEGKRWEDFYAFNKNGKWPVSFLAMGAGTLLVCIVLMVLQNL